MFFGRTARAVKSINLCLTWCDSIRGSEVPPPSLRTSTCRDGQGATLATRPTSLSCLRSRYLVQVPWRASKSFSALSCCHVAIRLNTPPFVFAAGLTIVLPSERPELGGDSSQTRTGLVSSFLAASKIAAAAFVRIWRLAASSYRESHLSSPNRSGQNGMGYLA
jgi:hypothetical protein